MSVIRKGAAADIPQIAAIYDRIHTREEAGQSTVGWVRDIYPTRATAQAALDAGELFVLEHGGAVAAAARINQIQVPEYANARWQHPQAPAEQVMVLHTLVVESPSGGQGAGHRLCPLLRGVRPGKGLSLSPHGHQREKPQRPGPVCPAGLSGGGHRGLLLQWDRRGPAGLSGKNSGMTAILPDAVYKMLFFPRARRGIIAEETGTEGRER